MAVTSNPVTAASPPDLVNSTAEQIPPLENGDRLTRPEFERRYEAMPGLKKAELIEGVVHVPSPGKFRKHSRPHASLMAWFTQYWTATPGVELGIDSSVRLDLDNMPQPDVLLLIPSEHGGQAQIDEDDYVSGAPELVAEIAASSTAYDLDEKLEVYRRNGVREYLIWRVIDQSIDWRILRDGRFERLDPDEAGLYTSEVFPGLWLDPAALLRGEMLTVIQVLQQGLASPEHAEFVTRLQEAAKGG